MFSSLLNSQWLAHSRCSTHMLGECARLSLKSKESTLSVMKDPCLRVISLWI